jgi:hypothetical protein
MFNLRATFARKDERQGARSKRSEAHGPRRRSDRSDTRRKKGPVVLCHRPKCLCPNETRGEDTGSRDDLPAEQGGGSGPWEVKPEVAT